MKATWLGETKNQEIETLAPAVLSDIGSWPYRSTTDHAGIQTTKPPAPTRE